MARTAVAYSNWAANSNLADPAGTTIDATLVTNGVKIAAADPEHTVLRIANTFGADKVATVNAGDYPPALASGQGNLAVTVAATSGIQWIGPFESGRFLQNDGTMEVDFASGFTGTITVFKLPRRC